MSIKRIAIAGIIAATLTLAACSSGETADPTTAPSENTTPTPTPSVTSYEPPATEEEAIAAAEETIKRIFEAQSVINAAGGVDASRYEDLAMGKGLEWFTQDATRIANGPLLNEDMENVEGQSSTEGAITFEVETAYGQQLGEIDNGLVLVPGCMDASKYKITTADGKPAFRPDSVRSKVELQVSYDTQRSQWLVSDFIGSSGQTC